MMRTMKMMTVSLESGELLEVSPLVAVGLEDLEDLKGRVQGKKESLPLYIQ